jgi:hypothetical protein
MDTEIQFDQVQRPTGASVCSSCRSTLLHSYYQANGKVLCERCATGIRNFFQSSEGGFGRFLKATVFGLGGGLAGGAIYTAVLALLHINFALITILIGWFVGKTVRQGSGGRGGVGYQILAVVLTYLTIGLSLTLSEIFAGEGVHATGFGLVFICVFGTFAAPVIDATSSLLGGVITFFGLMQAWRLNTPVQVAITGPHTIGPVTPIAAAPPVERYEPPVPPNLPAIEPPPAPSA